MTAALLQLRAVRREFSSGDGVITVLDDIDLDIHAGEMVAIVGASGSGKSTLMNLIGCLDRPTSGSYRVAGQDTGAMSPEQLAQLRREHFGFVFQRYHLLGDHHALGNVEMPAVYAGVDSQARHRRALSLLERLGLADRTHHRPGQLSGGQQQRVSIARALMNGGQVILADEPTGALDTRSGEEVMKILAELNAEGHTIILVTHDMSVARHARRIIEISDGVIVADRTNPAMCTTSRTSNGTRMRECDRSSWQGLHDRLLEAFQMALRAMLGHRLRTFLTTLGIVIGIASVVSVVALGNGSRQKLMEQVGALGTNAINVYPGRGFGDMRAGRVQTLSAADASALSTQNYVDGVTPAVSNSVTARYRNIAVSAAVTGVGAQYFRASGVKIAEGTAFDSDTVASMRQVVVIDQNARRQFFAGEDTSPIGKILLVGKVPCRVIGVVEKKSSALGGGGGSLGLWMPYTTVMARMLGQSHVSSITVRVRDGVPMQQAEAAISKLLVQRHGTRDFFFEKIDDIRATMDGMVGTITLLLGSIAAIALVVGGIGIMNIMLVSVTERTREIGVRMAVGARRSDILQQFMIEAVVVCLIGGALGVLLAFFLGWLFGLFVEDFGMVYSAGSIVAAFACSTLIGIVFGLLPARNAANLDPVEALARE